MEINFGFSLQVTIVDFAETVRSYQIIFPDSEQRLIELAQDYFLKYVMMNAFVAHVCCNRIGFHSTVSPTWLFFLNIVFIFLKAFWGY